MSEQRIGRSINWKGITRVASWILVIVVAIAIIAVIVRVTAPFRAEWREFQAWKYAQNIEVVSYEVKYGDSLWTIAKQYRADNQDIREMVRIILDQNGMANVELQPGQELLIPVKKSQ